MASFPLLF